MDGSFPAIHSSAPRHVFAYGSLVDPRCLDQVLGHPHTGERLAARLVGYERITTDAYPFPFIVAAQGRSVDGVLITDLALYDIQALDRYEEVDRGIYERRPVEVEVWGCGPRTMHLQAQTYVAGPALVASTDD
jgi:gamma-glutamylcyclotransferase (GGCT)/AIG2-like uncharacterized protein YtfP